MMHAAQPLAPLISEPMTWAEICERYPDQHVYLVDAVDDTESAEILSARVIGAGPIQEALAQAMQWRDHYEVITHVFTGRSRGFYIRPTIEIDDELRQLLRPQW
jgi:hypothetical protein